MYRTVKDNNLISMSLLTLKEQFLSKPNLEVAKILGTRLLLGPIAQFSLLKRFKQKLEITRTLQHLCSKRTLCLEKS